MIHEAAAAPSPRPERSPAVGAALHVVGALAWLALTVVVAHPLADALGTTPLVVVAASALVVVAVSTLLVWRALHAAAAHRSRSMASMAELEVLRRMFLGAVSHELRTPVTSMLGYAETLQEHHRTLSATSVGEFAGRLVANGQRLEQLILDLLELHPRPLVANEPTASEVDLDALLAEQVEAHLDGRHVVQLRSSVGLVVLDEHKTRRIVVELLDNVIRHTPPSTRVSVSATHYLDTVRLVVEDDGPGVDPVIATAVAEPFVQGRHVATHATPGLGIGLSLASRYATLHGGRLELRRSTSGGTRAEVTLPTLARGECDAAA